MKRGWRSPQPEFLSFAISQMSLTCKEISGQQHNTKGSDCRRVQNFSIVEVQSPIESSDELKQLRARLRKMSHEELVLFGKAARSLCRNRDCPDTFKWQLEEASAKWRGRHPKAQ